MNPQKSAKSLSGNPFAQLVSQKTENSNTKGNNTLTTNTVNFPPTTINQTYTNTVSNLNSNQIANGGTKANIQTMQKKSESSNYTEKTHKIVDMTKINQNFSKCNNPAVNTFKASMESDNALNNSSSSPKTGGPNMAKKSSKRPNQRDEIIVIDDLQTKNSHQAHQQTALDSHKNKVFANNTQPIIISEETGSQKAIILSQPNQNKSTPSSFFKNNTQSNPLNYPNTNLILKPLSDSFSQIKQKVHIVTNNSNSSQPQVTQLQNKQKSITGGIVGQTKSTVQTTSNGGPQNIMNASFNNKNQPSVGQTSSIPNNVVGANNQSIFISNSTGNFNLSASRVGTNNSQSANVGNIQIKINTNNQAKISNQPSAFTKLQNNNTNTNPSTSNNPSSSAFTNQNLIKNPTQVPNTFPQANNQNPLAQFANQNQNPQPNQPSNNTQGGNQTQNNGINLHKIQDMTAEQYDQKIKALHFPPSRHYQAQIKQIKQNHQKENENMDLYSFLNECIQNLQQIYGGLEELSTRPAILIDQFERNKILKQRCNQIHKTLAQQPHKMLVKIKMMGNKIAESLNYFEKMESKMQEQLEHHLSIAIKDFQEIKDEINQQALDLPNEGQHDLIKIYNHLTSIDSELSHLNQTADYYINLLQKQ